MKIIMDQKAFHTKGNDASIKAGKAINFAGIIVYGSQFKAINFYQERFISYNIQV